MLHQIVEIAETAGREIMKIYDTDFEVASKQDNSPLTIADKEANRIIVTNLKKLSDYPILSEEEKEIPYEIRRKWNFYWCVDPLDGTKEFIKKNGEFTVNIALIHQGEPILGVVYAPALEELYYAQKGEGAYKNGQRLHIKKKMSGPFRIVASKSHLNDETKRFIEKFDNANTVSRGSSLKLCMVAEGSADIYPRLAPTMEWDTAAADAIVRESGHMTYKINPNTLNRIKSIEDIRNLSPLVYNKPNLLNPWFVVL